MKGKDTTILIVDDDEGMRDTLEAALKRDYRVIKVGDGESALQVVDQTEVRVVLLDVVLPGRDGLEILQEIKEKYEDVEVIMISALREVETAVRAMKLGAYDYITKEFNYDELLTLIERVIDRQRNRREILYLRSEVEQHQEEEFLIGQSQRMQEVDEIIHKVARLPTTVLILGESGTGKELVARYIHKLSDLAERPFVTVDLAAIPRELIESTLFGHEKGAFTGAYRQHLGKFEMAHGGTLFLDEIGELRLDLQAKLLRAIQEGEIERVGGNKAIAVEVRLLCATRINLEQAVREGTFRDDLYYRINVVPIKLPPLRERCIDIPHLAQLFIKRYSRRFGKRIDGISQSALQILTNYHWPGNIRELENLMERLVVMAEGNRFTHADLPIEFYLPQPPQPELADAEAEAEMVREAGEGERIDRLKAACDTFERTFLIKALDKVKWNRVEAARSLGISLSTLRYRLARLNLFAPTAEEEAGRDRLQGS